MPFDSPMTNAIAHAMAAPINENAHSSFYGQSAMPAGLTYFGQFIAHDIVQPTDTNVRSRAVSPYLNLDSIYGSAPLHFFSNAPQLTGVLNAEGMFEFSDTKKLADADFQRIKRVRRDSDGKPSGCYFQADIPEQRNDENVIVAQLHILWQKLHNKLVTSYAPDPLEARRLVTLIFQCITIEQFLRHILSREVYQGYFVDDHPLPNWHGETREQLLPDYFTKASYRFGHSIVRRSYKLQDGKPAVNIAELFRRGKPLNDEHVIDWKKFFASDQQHSGRFDTKITSPMTNIPAFHAPNIAQHIAAKNLSAGQQAHLPTGTEMAHKLAASYPEIAQKLNLQVLDSLAGASFDGVPGLNIQELPLWPYLLLEAQQKSHGTCLGPLGSILNADVLKWSIQEAEFSVYTDGLYNFPTLMEILGPLGRDLINETGEEIAANRPKLDMMTIIRFIQQ